MRVYTKIVMDIATGEVKEAESFEYEGPLALCGKKSPSVPPPPPKPQETKNPEAVSQEARATQEERSKRYTGLNSSIMTGGMGLTGKAQTAPKVLLGR